MPIYVLPKGETDLDKKIRLTHDNCQPLLGFEYTDDVHFPAATMNYLEKKSADEPADDLPNPICELEPSSIGDHGPALLLRHLSDGVGWGVFALADIDENESLGGYAGVLEQLNNDTDPTCVMTTDDEVSARAVGADNLLGVNAKTHRNITGMFQHLPDDKQAPDEGSARADIATANVVVRAVRKTIVGREIILNNLFTARKIAAGEQLGYPYSQDVHYWLRLGQMPSLFDRRTGKVIPPLLPGDTQITLGVKTAAGTVVQRIPLQQLRGEKNKALLTVIDDDSQFVALCHKAMVLQHAEHGMLQIVMPEVCMADLVSAVRLMNKDVQDHYQEHKDPRRARAEFSNVMHYYMPNLVMAKLLPHNQANLAEYFCAVAAMLLNYSKACIDDYKRDCTLTDATVAAENLIQQAHACSDFSTMALGNTVQEATTPARNMSRAALSTPPPVEPQRTNRAKPRFRK